MNENKEYGAVRQILRSEVTWLVFVIVGVWGFVTTVVLPLQDLRQQLTHLQTDIQREILAATNLDARVKALEIEHARITR